MYISKENMTDLMNFLNVCKAGIFILNKEHVIEYANKEVERLLKTNIEDISGRSFYDFTKRIFRVKNQLEIKKIIQGRKDSFIVIWCESLQKWLEIYVYFLNGFKYAITVKDISKEKNTENELLKRKNGIQELAEELEKTGEQKDNFISNLSHELRNPLATISMGIQLMDHIQPGCEVDIETRKVIKRQTNHMIGLVSDLLNVNQIIRNKIRLKKESTEINNFVRETIEDYDYLFKGEEIQLNKHLHNEPIYLDLDPIRFKQVLGNILSNALKFTPKNGEVSLNLFRIDDQKTLIIEVKDTGVGIEPDLMKDLFEPFRQADYSLTKENSGLGIGLAIVKGIVDLHGGSIKVESEGLGKGTTVIIGMPIE